MEKDVTGTTSGKSGATSATPTTASPAQADSTPAIPAATANPTTSNESATTATPAMKDADKPAQAAAQPSADQAVVEKLRELSAGKFDRIFNSKKERTAVNAFYTARNYAPLWITDGAANDRAKAAIAHLKSIDADGLEPADYPVPEFKVGAEATALAEAELRLTASVITYARHAQIGRVHFSRISADIFYAQVTPEPADVLAKLADAKNAGEALSSFNPPHAGYKALKVKLAETRAQKGNAGPERIANGPLLKIGVNDSRVPLLRQRLGVTGDAANMAYDKPLSDAVKKFQQQRKLQASGNLNSSTIDALNGPRRDRDADIIIANMERWRWIGRDLGGTYVMLNIPDYSLKVVHDGATKWQTRVVVGKPNTATPLLSETMKYITVNPTWNVPPSIVYNEYLPALQQDPTVLDRMGLKLVQNADGSVHISQPPGEANALGRIRFNFPNKFLVYQHDTPDKHLFAHDKRAYSHGCMRVQDPIKYAEVLLSIVLPKEGYTQDRIRKMFGHSEVDIKFPTSIPVHITYQTAFVDDAGHLVIREDIYGRDARVLNALKGDERKVADIPMERAQQSYNRPPVTLPYSARYAGGGSFFDRLFGSGAPTPPAPVRPRRNVPR